MNLGDFLHRNSHRNTEQRERHRAKGVGGVARYGSPGRRDDLVHCRGEVSSGQTKHMRDATDVTDVTKY